MSASEYIFIFYSFILALAVGEIARGVGNLLRLRNVKYSLLHLAWVGLITFSILEFWWGSWSLQNSEGWSIYGMLVGFLSTFVLYLAAFLSFPLNVEEEENLENYYFLESSRLWSLYALLLCNNLLANRAFGEAGWARIYPQDVLLLVLISLCVVAARSKRKVIHWAVLTSFYITGAAIVLVAQPFIGQP